MEWNEYKAAVEGSRREIVFPYFGSKFKDRRGPGLDIGCGDGDLTAYIAEAANCSIVGIDIVSHAIGDARKREGTSLHFVIGNLEKRVIPSIGIQFDFAYSNCSLQELSDAAVNCLLADLHTSMASDSELLILVPSFEWAKDKYKNVEFVENGITAVPRFGGRQTFRLHDWYTTALNARGFYNVKHEQIRIPNSPTLESRYRDCVGHVLFDAFSARNTAQSEEQLKKAFEIAHDNRILEIGLFWQRSLFFWGFVGASLVGYGAVYDKSRVLTTVLALLGLVCSVVWTAANRGSKYWQEYWEDVVESFQNFYAAGHIFDDRKPRTDISIWSIYTGRRISVSKLAMALSDYMTLVWLTLCVLSVAREYFELSITIYKYGSLVALVLTLIYCATFIWQCGNKPVAPKADQIGGQ
jgi:SAM-dependent methyltransferase